MLKVSLLIMKKGNKTYWKGIEQLKNDPAFVKNAESEFPEFLPIKDSSDNSRRDFLKMMGFGLAAVSTAACEAPVKYAIPYVDKPVDVDATLANYYASTYSMGSDYCSVVVKTREGRPIKIDGNKYSKISAGCTSSQVESSVLTLYDRQRLQFPMLNNKESNWRDVDNFVKEGFSKNRKPPESFATKLSSVKFSKCHPGFFIFDKSTNTLSVTSAIFQSLLPIVAGCSDV